MPPPVGGRGKGVLKERRGAFDDMDEGNNASSEGEGGSDNEGDVPESVCGLSSFTDSPQDLVPPVQTTSSGRATDKASKGAGARGSAAGAKKVAKAYINTGAISKVNMNFCIVWRAS